MGDKKMHQQTITSFFGSHGAGRGAPSTPDASSTGNARGRGERGRGRGGRGRGGRGRGEGSHSGPPAARAARAQKAEEILTLLFKDPYRYTAPNDTVIVVRDCVKASVRNSLYFGPNELPEPPDIEDRLVSRYAQLDDGSQKAGPDLEVRHQSPVWDIEMETDDASPSGNLPTASSSSLRTDFTPPGSRTRFTIHERSTVAGARELGTIPGGHVTTTWHIPATGDGRLSRTGVLNFASAMHPGGGFIGGAQAQEEALCRASTLYAALISEQAESFYGYHRRAKANARRERGHSRSQPSDDQPERSEYGRGVYSDAMVYTPGVIIVRDERDVWASPVMVNVATSAAVNAGIVRQQAQKDAEEENGRVDEVALKLHIIRLMRSRMHRILALFLQQGDSKLVLGSFGTGVFQNSVRSVAEIWAELLVIPGAPFENVFEEVEFSILGHGTFTKFREVWAGIIDNGAM